MGLAGLILLGAVFGGVLAACALFAREDIQRAIDAHRAATEAERVADRHARDADWSAFFKRWNEHR